MFKKIFLLLLVFVFCGYSFGKQCSDCVTIPSCPEARKIAGELSARDKFKEAFCGVDVKTHKPKICCSEFKQETIITEKRFGEDETELDIDYEAHPNFGLLPRDCGRTAVDRIFGGEYAGLYEFPWMALISYVVGTYKGKRKYEFRCGGSVINSRYVLTAAHCIKDRRVAGVRIGDYDIRTKDDCVGEYPLTVCEHNLQDFNIEKKIVHSGYKKTPLPINDIALLRLSTPIDFSFKNARPVCLPLLKSLKSKDLHGKYGTVAGWGLTETFKASMILKKVDLPVKAISECEDYYNRNNETDVKSLLVKTFCAGEAGKDSCKGDSGGPMMMLDTYYDFYSTIQYGVVSFGPQQCGSNTPGVYTDVTKYLKWILDNIEA